MAQSDSRAKWRFAAGYSADEKRALFHGTAAKAYRLNLD